MWSGPPYIAANHHRPIDAGDRQRNASQYPSTINAQLATSDRLSRNDSRTLMIHLLHQPNVAARGDGHATQLRQKIAQENPKSSARGGRRRLGRLQPWVCLLFGLHPGLQTLRRRRNAARAQFEGALGDLIIGWRSPL